MNCLKRIFILIFILFNFIYVDNTFAATIAAKSCSQSDVQAAINSAIDGDIITVPSGTCTWTSPSANNPAVEIYQKEIILQGAGIDKTIIQDNTYYLDQKAREAALYITGLDGKQFRISGFTVDGLGLNEQFGSIVIVGTSKKWRMDHVKIKNIKSAVRVSGNTSGVIDNSIFEAIKGGIAVGVYGDGDNAWKRPLSLGTADAIYIEDSTVSGTGKPFIVDCYNGGRFVIRHNTVVDGGLGVHDLCYTGMRGCHSYEIYENNFSMSSYTDRLFHIRSGTGVIYNNVITGDYNKTFDINHLRTCNINNRCNMWGQCNGTNPKDGNSPGGYGYVCLDQPGAVGLTSEPLYEWGNTDNGLDTDFVLSDDGCTNPSTNDHLRQGRDFSNDTVRPGYTPYTYPHPLTVSPSPPSNPIIQ